MVELYARLIIANRRLISAVPERYKADVVAMLKELGYDENGNPLPESGE